MVQAIETRSGQLAGSENKVAIEVRNLHRTYGSKKAVAGVDFVVLQGEIFGILGPNGAGKSTTLEIIEGLRQPDHLPGTQVMVDGLDVQNARQCAELHQRIGLQLQTSALFEELTVAENLDLLASLYRKARSVKGLLQEFNLEEKAKARLSTLSGGQQQRVALAAALVNDPTVIFLDEPTTALDPQARRNVWDSLRQLQQAGKTIIMTTHYMEEAEVLCDRVAIMDDGRIVALGTPAQLIRQYACEQTITCQFDRQAHTPEPEGLASLAAVSRVTPVTGGHTLYTTNLGISLAALLRMVESCGATISEITTHSPTLEDVFINLTGKQLRD